MFASLRPGTIRLLTRLHRLTSQPACLTRLLCRGPPEDSEQNGEAKTTATVKNTETLKKSQESQSIETQAEAQRPTQETEENETDKSKLHEASHEYSKKDEAAAGKQDTFGNEKSLRQKKLHDLLSSLASADPIPVEPNVQLSRPKARKKKARAPEKTALPSKPEPDLDPELMSATKEVAESLGGDVKETESELLSTLRLHSTETNAQSAPSLSELFMGMKVERKPKSEMEEVPRHRTYDTTISHSQPSLPRDRPRRSQTQSPVSSVSRNRVDLFGGQPLGIFIQKQESTSKPSVSVSVLPTWEKLHLRELQQSMSHPPSNAFVEMIQWTNEGKLWTFPIDNETGLEEEKKVGFHEHVFLERHLEGWCPQRGPIRHFMELVCTGLSKNPYLTVERKQAHIAWYKNYFSQKEQLLKELGAIEN